MRPFQSHGIPINPAALYRLSEPLPYHSGGFGRAPFGTSPFRGLVVGSMGSYINPAARSGVGLGGACDCGPNTGCSCAGLNAYDPGMAVFGPKRGMHGLGQTSSLDQIIANAASWLGGWAQSQLPSSAAVPPQYGSTGAIGTQLLNLAPWVIGGYLVYKLIK